MAPSRRGPFGSARPLSLAALDAAISTTIERPVRRDRLARDDAVYQWICRRSIVEGCFTWRCTYAEAAAGAGYSVPRLNCRENRKQARQMRVSTVYRALCSLRAAGLITFEGVKHGNGKWRCLKIKLRRAGRGRPPAGFSARRPTRCPGRRVSFGAQSGTSPPVGGKISRSTPRFQARVRAREERGPPDDPQHRATVREAIRRSLAGEVDDWATAPTDPAAAAVRAFEVAFGKSAKFSVDRRHHGEELRSIVACLDRFHEPGLERHYEEGPGLELVRRWIKFAGECARRNLGEWAKVESLAYLLPELRKMARRRRRAWRRRHGKLSAAAPKGAGGRPTAGNSGSARGDSPNPGESLT